MSEKNLESLVTSALEKLHTLADGETVVGKPIVTGENVTIIPISKVSIGFGAGGSDLPTKGSKDLFGGGSGAGVSVTPLAFITIANGEVKLLEMTAQANPTNAVVNLVPQVIDKITGFLNKDKKEEKETEEETED